MTGLAELAGRLGQFDPEPVQQRALAEAAQCLDEALRDALSAPESAEQRTTAIRAELRNSMAHRVETGRAIIGTTSMAARRREIGSRHVPPRPLVAPLAAERGKSIAGAVGAAIADAIRAALTGRSIG